MAETGMVERVKAALIAEDESVGGSRHAAYWDDMARAAIEAMRNPPDCVLDAMNPSGRYASTIVPEAWNDAIDAILKEEGE